MPLTTVRLASEYFPSMYRQYDRKSFDFEFCDEFSCMWNVWLWLLKAREPGQEKEVVTLAVVTSYPWRVYSVKRLSGLNKISKSFPPTALHKDRRISLTGLGGRWPYHNAEREAMEVYFFKLRNVWRHKRILKWQI